MNKPSKQPTQDFSEPLSKEKLLDYLSFLGYCPKKVHQRSYLYNSYSISVIDSTKVQELAKAYLDFHKSLLGYDNFEGTIESSGSAANFKALEIAKETSGKSKVLCTTLSHCSIIRACKQLGLELVVLKVDNSFQVNETELKKVIDKESNSFAAVVSTYGTTQLGRIELLGNNQLVQELRRKGTLLHLDAAYGGTLAAYSDSTFEKFPTADTITLDPHKFIGKPGCSLLLAKSNQLEKVRPTDAGYYTPSSYTTNTTLSIEPIVAWYYLHQEGLAKIKGYANHCISSAKRIADTLKSNGIELICEPQLGIVPVKLSSQSQVNYVKEQLLKNRISVGTIHLPEIKGVRLVCTSRVPERYRTNQDKLVSKLIRTIQSYGDC